MLLVSESPEFVQDEFHLQNFHLTTIRKSRDGRVFSNFKRFKSSNQFLTAILDDSLQELSCPRTDM